MSDLLREIELFCARHGMPPTRFGKLAMNDKAFVFALRAGRDVFTRTAAKVRRFMAEYSEEK